MPRSVAFPREQLPTKLWGLQLTACERMLA